MLTLIGSSAFILIGVLIVVVVGMVFASKALKGAQDKGVVITDGISKDEAMTILDEVIKVVKDANLDPREILQIAQIFAQQKEDEAKEAEITAKKKAITKIKEGAEKAIAKVEEAK